MRYQSGDAPFNNFTFNHFSMISDDFSIFYQLPYSYLKSLKSHFSRCFS